jgi:iron complex outermembrane recepter protein
MRTKFFAGVAFAALMIPGAAFAQSSGTTDFEEGSEIVVTGSRADNGVGGIVVPDVPKSRATINSELISRQRPGQSVNEIINLVPGVSFQNNDATGSAGGTFTIRGFDSSRISQTLDGIPLNDTGNYAIYSNQQQDPETLESVSVNLGTTDVDSPTASAVGGTVNIRTRVPSQNFGAVMIGTYGDYLAEGSGTQPIFRAFGMVDTGDIAHTGVRAFFSASNTDARQPFNNYGKIRKQQYNARIYRDIGSNGDFISLAGQYNENRNNFFGSVPLRTDLTNGATARIVGPNSSNRFPLTREERFYDINYPCTINTVARPGVADNTAAAPANPTAGASCGSEFDRRYNPSNTGNVRFGSRWTLAEGLILTVDASYQYTKANGGGVVAAREGCTTLGTAPVVSAACGAGTYTGVFNAGPNTGNGSPGGFGTYVGRDLNGDGDLLDTVYITNPSQTQTRRFGAVAGLTYNLNEDNRIRLVYTWDRGRHRQTGESGFLQSNGEPFDVFPVNNGILTNTGAVLEKRDRLSYAILNQVSGEYRGTFGDLTVQLGVRAPFFKRELDQNCFTIQANGNVSCVSPSQTAAYGAANAYRYYAPGVATVDGIARPTTGSCATLTNTCVVGFAPPQERTLNYKKVLPNVGVTYKITPALSMYASFAQGLSVPSTDNLYNAFYFPAGTEAAKPKPETSNSFDLGVRYTTGRVQAQVAGWYTSFKNRIVSVYNVELDTSTYYNLGTVKKGGVDASIAFKPAPDLLVYAFGSYLYSRIQDNIPSGDTTFLLTKGKREGGSPEWTFGGRVQGTVGPVDLGAQAKYTGSRFVNDENLSILSGTTEVYGAKIPSYAVVDLDMRINLGKIIDGMNNRTYFQLNVGNLFDKLYVGGLSGSNGFVGAPSRTTIPNVVIGTPRSIMGSLSVGF